MSGSRNGGLMNWRTPALQALTDVDDAAAAKQIASYEFGSRGGSYGPPS